MISFAAITPHPPIIIPGIGQEADLQLVANTVVAMRKLGQELEAINPDVLVIVSPHAPLEPYSFGINRRRHLEGSFLDFGLDRSFRMDNDLQLVDHIMFAGQNNDEDVKVHAFESQLDHGALVPLFYLTRNIQPLVVHLSFSFLSLERHFDFGEVIGKIIGQDPRSVAIVASGDLSHRLTKHAPAGYSSRGAEFDRELISMLSNNFIRNILGLKSTFTDEAGECGLRSIVMLLGMLKQEKYSFRLLSYEGPFGVGYLTARLL